jgi:hypothetical protein
MSDHDNATKSARLEKNILAIISQAILKRESGGQPSSATLTDTEIKSLTANLAQALHKALEKDVFHKTALEADTSAFDNQDAHAHATILNASSPGGEAAETAKYAAYEAYNLKKKLVEKLSETIYQQPGFQHLDVTLWTNIVKDFMHKVGEKWNRAEFYGLDSNNLG